MKVRQAIYCIVNLLEFRITSLWWFKGCVNLGKVYFGLWKLLSSWASNSSTWRSFVVLAPLSARITCSGVIWGVSLEALNHSKVDTSKNNYFWLEWGDLPFILVLMNGGSQIGRGSLETFSSQALSLLGHPRVWWWQNCTLCGWTWVWRWWERLCYGHIQCVWFAGWSIVHFHRCRKVNS